MATFSLPTLLWGWCHCFVLMWSGSTHWSGNVYWLHARKTLKTPQNLPRWGKTIVRIIFCSSPLCRNSSSKPFPVPNGWCLLESGDVSLERKISLLSDCDANQREASCHLCGSSVIVCSVLPPFSCKMGLKAITAKPESLSNVAVHQETKIFAGLQEESKGKWKCFVGNEEWGQCLQYSVHTFVITKGSFELSWGVMQSTCRFKDVFKLHIPVLPCQRVF